MSIRLRIGVDYSQVSDMRKRNALHLPRVKNAYARRAAELIRDEAILRAPFDAQNTSQEHLREGISVIQNGPADYTVEAVRTNPDDGFDVALWTHEAYYTPSDPSPGVGRRYLARAVEENEGQLNGVISDLVDDWLRSL